MELDNNRSATPIRDKVQPKPILKKPLFPAREMLEKLEPALPALQFREIEPAPNQAERALRRTKGTKTKPYSRHLSPPEKSIEDIIRDAGRGRSRALHRGSHKSLDLTGDQAKMPVMS